MEKVGPETLPDVLEAAPRLAGGRRWQRFLIRCHVVAPGEDLRQVVRQYLGPVVRSTDIAVLGQKLVSITQGRLVRLEEAGPSWIARTLARTVRRTPHGLGLGRPETMEMAVREVGLVRILWACLFGLWDHLTGQSGHFYVHVGPRVRSIDGPGPGTLPPYDQCVILCPDDSTGIARRMSRLLGCAVVVVDANDLAVEVLGASATAPAKLVPELLSDNPMGQGAQRTPLMVLRPGSP